MLPPCEEITQRMGELFWCSPVNGYTRIRTPYLYPDGDIIDLFLKQAGDSSTVTDLGETLRWLRMQSIAQRRSPRQNQLIEDVCMNHGVEFFRGMLMVRVKPSAGPRQRYNPPRPSGSESVRSLVHDENKSG